MCAGCVVCEEHIKQRLGVVLTLDGVFPVLLVERVQWMCVATQSAEAGVTGVFCMCHCNSVSVHVYDILHARRGFAGEGDGCDIVNGGLS